MQGFAAPHSMPMHHDRTSCGADHSFNLAHDLRPLTASMRAGLSVLFSEQDGTASMRAGLTTELEATSQIGKYSLHARDFGISEDA